jgi:alpha-1,3-glucosyltransferase
MHGDYEAQRHWMEITRHLPVSQWYFYDLQYWGLDYPPLTAYHSWVLGWIGSFINPKWFTLDASRGFESPDLKIYMRATVLISEYLTYIPALVFFNRRWARIAGVGTWESSIALTAILMQPATILIDHAHFQYNTVMLGLFVASMDSMLAGRYLWASVCFVASLCFKQMALYFAPAVFAYLLGVCIRPKINVPRFTAIAIVTVVSFAVMFAPLIAGAEYDYIRNGKLIRNLQPPYLYMLVVGSIPWKLSHTSLVYPAILQLTQAVFRIFPLARGLFEDKVANVWCALHTVYKLNYLPIPFLSRLSLLATLASVLPACIITLLSPRKTLLPYAFASCAWGFFLFSFQVHEKSVLLPLLPMTLLLGGKGGLGAETRTWVGFANLLGSWTMYPLLKRDELRTPYIVLNLLWAFLLGLPPVSASLYTQRDGVPVPVKILHGLFYVAMLAWHAVEATVAPPKRKPDLWVVLNCVIGAAGFGILYLWCTWNLFQKSGLAKARGDVSKSKKTN